MRMTRVESLEKTINIINDNTYLDTENIKVMLLTEIAGSLAVIADAITKKKERRKQPEIIRCKDCENWDTTWQNDSAPNYHYCPMIDGSYSGDFYCAKAEGRTDDND